MLLLPLLRFGGLTVPHNVFCLSGSLLEGDANGLHKCWCFFVFCALQSYQRWSELKPLHPSWITVSQYFNRTDFELVRSFDMSTFFWFSVIVLFSFKRQLFVLLFATIIFSVRANESSFLRWWCDPLLRANPLGSKPLFLPTQIWWRSYRWLSWSFSSACSVTALETFRFYLRQYSWRGFYPSLWSVATTSSNGTRLCSKLSTPFKSFTSSAGMDAWVGSVSEVSCCAWQVWMLFLH